MQVIRYIAILISSFISIHSAFGQAGVSSLSVGVGRAGVGHWGPNGKLLMPSADMIRIEEYINYHRHDLPLPQAGKRVRLTVDQIKLDKTSSIVQVGITTPRMLSKKKMKALNLVLVIDRSGSMSGDRIANVKKAIRDMLEQIRESDKISIVGFSSDARVHLQPTEKTEVSKIDSALQEIRSGGGTNLIDGLMLGYRQALKHFDSERTNRIIFLTDGNANIGTTETHEIARQSKECNQRGISLSTIGLGKDFNHELLRELADRGKGVVHFVNDSEDIKKTFTKEIDSLLAPAANRVRLKVDFGNSGNTPVIFGYQPKQKHGSFVFRLADLNHGATQVVIAKIDQPATTIVKAELEYVDAINNTKQRLNATAGKYRQDSKRVEAIKRNYAIGVLGKSIKRSSEHCAQKNYVKAERVLSNGIRKARSLLVNEHDKAANVIIDLAKVYRKNLKHLLSEDRD